MAVSAFARCMAPGQLSRPALKTRLAQLAARRRDPSFRLFVAVALVMLLAAGAFAHLAEDYLTGDPIVRWDVTFAGWLHAHSVAVLISAFKVVTLAGNVAVLAVVTVGAAAWLLRRRAFNEALLVCAVGFGIEVLNAGLKLAFHRPRPLLAYVHLETYSFPSGHAAGAAATYGVLIFLIARHGRPRRRVACGLLFLITVSAIGFSRLYLEAHYLSDVLAGFSVGLLWLSGCLLIYLWAGDRSVLTLLPRRLRSLILGISR
jgi:membrane-associated phospholipid phosphatase